MFRFLIIFTFTLLSLSANENWIKIEPNNKPKIPKSTTKLNINLSQIKPINKMIKNATVIKQLFDVTRKKEKKVTSDKNWFVIKNKGNSGGF